MHDSEGGTTFCPQCKAALIVRDWYDIRRYDLTPEGIARIARPPSPAVFGKVLGRDGRASAPTAFLFASR